MKLERIELKLMQMPLLNDFVTSFGRVKEKTFILVCAHAEGAVGYGESTAMDFPMYSEETTETVWYMLEKFMIPMLFAAEIEHPRDVSRLLSPIRRNNMAKAALEGAIWDLYGKLRGQSLASLLGGTRREIDVGVSIGIEPSIDRLLARVERFMEEGYKKIKVKIKPGFDVAAIEAIRKRFGDDLPLMADANSAYTLDQLDILKEMDQYGLMMIEQPLAHDDIIDHAKLQRELKTPICLDESIHSAEDARKAIGLGSCRVINIKIGRVGGLEESRNIHDLCLASGIDVWCGGMLEAGIGRAHNIAIASLPGFTIPGDTSASSRYWAEDIVEPEVTMAKPGVLSVPDGPGIGYRLNESVCNKYMIRSQNFRK